MIAGGQAGERRAEPGDDGVRGDVRADAAASSGGAVAGGGRGLIPTRPDPGPGEEAKGEGVSGAALPNGGEPGGDGLQAPLGAPPAETEPPSR